MKNPTNLKDKIISLEQLSDLREKNKDKKIVFTVGCFDLLHHGHVHFFNDCAKLGDILVVGIGRDSTIKLLKGEKRPINPELNRLLVLAALQDIDYVVLNEEMVGSGRTNEYLETKIDFKAVLENLRPDIFVLGADTISSPIKAELCKRLGIEVCTVSKDICEGSKRISSTDIAKALESGKE